MDFDFSEIKFHGDDELDEVIQRLLDEPTIYRISRFLNNDISEEKTRELLESFGLVRNFQIDFILNIIKKLISKNIDELTSDGTDNLSHSRDSKYVFITNHRNIVMDASLLNHELHKTFDKDFESTAIAIGDNLLSIPWVKDMARLNKSFVVIRGASVQKMLENTKKLSHYMRQLVLNKKSSVWIAQREGRTKDGNDITQQGLLKMLQMSGGKDFVDNYSELHLVPVAISYEYDPCVKDKVKELASIENTGSYVKGPLDDFNSMHNGMMGYKGRVHYSFGKEITPDILQQIDGDIPRNEKIHGLAGIIDGFIHSNYRLWPNNFIAADMLNNKVQFTDKYDADDKSKFDTLMSETLDDLDGDTVQNKRIFLTMFANPVKNAHKLELEFIFDF